MTAYLLTVVGLFGLIIGSFLNVVIWRVPQGKSLLPRSACPNCETPVQVRDNIPVFSWVLLRAKCRDCATPISVKYPLVEALTGAIFVLVAVWLLQQAPVWQFFGGGTPAETAAIWLTLFALLWFAASAIALVAIDLAYYRLPDVIVLPSVAVVGICLGAASILLGDMNALIRVVSGGVIAFLLFALIVLVYPKGMGGGDVKLAPVIGMICAWQSWGALVVGVFAGFVIGAIVGVLLLWLQKIERNRGIPFGPSMLAGAIVGLLWGEQISTWYLNVSNINTM